MLRPRPRWGNLRRPGPFGRTYGAYDRGTPVDRVYLGRFFATHGADITGRVLEVRDPWATEGWGHDVQSVDLVDIDPGNRRATIVADLAEAGSLPASAFDCVIVPQTLHLVDDVGAALENLWQTLAPGGVLLVTAPCIAHLDKVTPVVDRWRLTPSGLRCLLDAACPGAEIEVTPYGSMTACLAFLLGVAAEELRPADLEPGDPAYVLVTCASVRRPKHE